MAVSKGNGGKKLTPKQQRFVEEYLVDLNAAAAARRAGYSAKTAKLIGFENLTKPHLVAIIEERKKALAQDAGITVAEVLRELRAVYRSRLTDFGTWGEGKLTLTESADLTDEQSAALSEIQQTKDGQIKVKLHAKGDALDKAMRYLGLYTPEAAGGSIVVNVLAAASVQPSQETDNV